MNLLHFHMPHPEPGFWLLVRDIAEAGLILVGGTLLLAVALGAVTLW